MEKAAILPLAFILVCGCMTPNLQETTTTVYVKPTTTLSAWPPTTTQPVMGPIALVSYMQGPCQQNLLSKGVGGKDAVIVARVGGGLEVHHLLNYVCCANITVTVNVTAQDTIDVWERNVGKMCKCMCAYNVTARISGTDPSKDYLVRVWGVEYPGQEVKLLASTSKSGVESGCAGLTAEQCRANPKCKLRAWMCDYVSEGKTFEEVCPRGSKGVDCVPNDLRSLGEMCGGIAGFACEPGLTCLLEGDYPDASGECVKSQNECSRDADCAVGGCSGQVCTAAEKAKNLVTTCEWKSEYDCYKLTTCSCLDGKCQWMPSRKFNLCLDEKKQLT